MEVYRTKVYNYLELIIFVENRRTNKRNKKIIGC